MRKITILLMLLMLSSFRDGGSIGCKKDRGIKKIEIKVADFDIMTVMDVDCDDFERYFSGEYSQVFITDSVMIDRLSHILDRLELTDSSDYRWVDTRAKIYLYSDIDYSKSKTTTICVDQLRLNIDGKMYKTPQELINFIEKYNW